MSAVGNALATSRTFKHGHFLVGFIRDDGLTVAVKTVDVVMPPPLLPGVHADGLFEDEVVGVDVGNPAGEVEDVVGASRRRSHVEVGRLIHVDPQPVEVDTLFVKPRKGH